jgi:hypothetical protein
MVYAFFGTLVLILAVWIGYGCGKHVERQSQEQAAQERAEAERTAREHRARQLRELGRRTDVREDATGAPATVHPIVVLGKSPRHRPPTRM